MEMKKIVSKLKNLEKLEKIRLKRLEIAFAESKGNIRRDIARSIWKIKNPEKNRKQKNEYYQRNKDKIVKKQSVYQKQYRTRNPEVYNAYKLLARIKVSGLCSECNENIATQKHHEDYSKPYDVVYVCNKCHAKLDKIRRWKVKN